VDLVLSFHRQLATVLVLYYAAVGLWGLALGIRKLGPTPGFGGAIVIAEIAAVAQGAFGVLVFLFLKQPSDSIHILYGVLLALAMPLAGSIARERTPRGQAVALGLAALFAAGLAIRGITTA
jgi:hypothetical protein